MKCTIRTGFLAVLLTALAAWQAPAFGGFLEAAPAAAAQPFHPMQNPVDPLDVNDDGSVAPVDALIVINSLNSVGSRPIEASVEPSLALAPAGAPYLDTNGDNFIGPLDALIVINHLNALGSDQHAVPEPSSILLIAIAIASLLCRPSRRRIA